MWSPSQKQDGNNNNEADESGIPISDAKTSMFSLYFYPNKEVKDFLNDIKKRLDDITVIKPEIEYEVGLSDKITIQDESEEEHARKIATYEGIYGYFKYFFSRTFIDTTQVNSEEKQEEDVDEDIKQAMKELKEPICIYIIIKGLKIETVGGVRELENILIQLKDFV
jgi:hypothetical protein